MKRRPALPARTSIRARTIASRCLVAISVLACAACGANVTNDITVDCDANGVPISPPANSSGSGAGASTGGGAASGANSGGSGSAGSSGTGGGGTSSQTQSLQGLFSTGVDASGAPLADGAVDPHYVLTSNDPATPGPDAVAVAPVAPAWTSNTSTSKWISLNTGTTGANAGETYQYTTTFNLSGVDPTTATLSGTWACDDSCTMQLNGAQVAAYALPAWQSAAPFNVPAGSPFKLGTNTLTITVPNSDVFATGLQIVSISGSANPVSNGTGGTGGGNNGSVTTGQTLSTGPLDFCVVAPWNDSPQQFVSSTSATVIPAGSYTLRYVGGAQNHDEYQQYGGNYEVSAHYAIDGLEAGHHIYDGADPYSSITSVWLDASGLVGDLPDVATVESTNAGHTWPIALAGGPLFVTYYDNYYGDNIGPGTELCIDASQQ